MQMLETWQEELKNAVRSISELHGYKFLNKASLQTVEDQYRILVPQYYLSLIDPEDPEDPIARMAFPAPEEADQLGLRDPIGDLAKQAAPRLTHRYKDRALLHTTNLCPMYCRFCFRKNLMNESEANLYRGEFAEALNYVRAHPEIHELILTGGDPWMLSNERLNSLADQIAEIPTVEKIRFHTRMPVTLPSRVTTDMVAAILRPGRLQTVVVTHFNHPREITKQSSAAIQKLRAAHILVLNQTVLLRGVNDNIAILVELFRSLDKAGVLPYYLHHCDLVAGGGHFRLPLSEGRKLWQSLRGQLPGYLIPEYVLDLPGGKGKIPVGGDEVKLVAEGEYLIHANGAFVSYQDRLTNETGARSPIMQLSS